MSEQDYDDHDCDDDEFDDELEDRFDCGLDPESGQCAMAGTEDCDFECPHRNSSDFAGSRAYCQKHKQLFYTEVQLARHALGLTGDRTQSYRNHFVCGEGSNDYPGWMNIVAKGLAIRVDKRKLYGGDWLFILTREGAEQALYKGDSLDREDFPRSAAP